MIKDFTLSIKPGSVTALVGESGCGKSTLIKLLLGFYTPTSGKLRLGGVDIEEADASKWLQHCGAVMQEGKIFSGSILDNVALSDGEPDIAKARDALYNVGLLEFVDSLPMGLNTNLGVAGVEMSGGQKQRLMIARALYKDPEILFLDEATSSLDANNERTIVENINRLGGGKTIVIAAHRLSTVRNADRIILIKEGRIQESGTHEELYAQKGEYRKLVKNQLMAQETVIS